MKIEYKKFVLLILINFFFPFQNISILVVLLYAWRIGVNIKKYGDLEDVYYGKHFF